MELARKYPNLKMAILEKEKELGKCTFVNKLPYFSIVANETNKSGQIFKNVSKTLRMFMQIRRFPLHSA